MEFRLNTINNNNNIEDEYKQFILVQKVNQFESTKQYFNLKNVGLMHVTN